MILSQIIGKLRKSLWKFRRLKASMTMCKLIGITKLWISKKKTKNRVTVVNLIETTVTKSILVRLMYQYRRKIIFIQRTMKRLIIENRLTWSYRLLMWSRFESKIIIRRKDKALTRPKLMLNRKERLSVRERAFSKLIVPPEVKSSFIKHWFLERIREHVHMLEEHKKLCQTIVGEYKKLIYKRLFSESLYNISLGELIFPPKPKIVYDLNEAEMRKLVITAHERAEMWEAILLQSDLKKRFYKNMPRN